MTAQKLELGGKYLYAQQLRSGVIELHSEFRQERPQIIYLCPGDIVELYWNYCSDGEPREEFLARKWGRDPAHPK